MTGIFSILAVPLGWVMRWIYLLVQNYGWTIIIFTFLVRILMFPLTMKQQKSTARMSAYQPMIQEIQKKWANDKNRQNQEMQKFYEENNISMSAGCLPMVVNMLVLFGIIAVIQAPLQYILQIPNEQINAGVAIVQYYEPESDIGAASGAYTKEAKLIGAVRENPERFTQGVEAPSVNGTLYILQEGETFRDGKIYGKDNKVVNESATLMTVSLDTAEVTKIRDFKFTFMGLNLADAPTLDNWVTLIMPVLSILTMLLSQIIIMLTSPSPQGKGQMIIMTVVFGVMFGFFAFRVPAGFSLYYTISNVVMTLQQMLVKRIYDPEKIKQEVEDEINARRAAKKAKKKVTLKTDDGKIVEQEMSEADLARLRLEKARQMDAEKYQPDDEEVEKLRAAADVALKLDEERYGRGRKKKITAGEADEESEDGDETAADADDESEMQDEADADNAQAGGASKKKAGRRKRATQKKGELDNAAANAGQQADADTKEDEADA